MRDRTEIDARMHRMDQANLRPPPIKQSSPCKEHGCELKMDGKRIWTEHKTGCPFQKMKDAKR